MSIIWLNGVKTDSVAKAAQRAKRMVDACVRHFHDPDRLAGEAIATRLGGAGKIAWDIYLFADTLTDLGVISRWIRNEEATLFAGCRLINDSITAARPAR
jgi:hypothetical protein